MAEIRFLYKGELVAAADDPQLTEPWTQELSEKEYQYLRQLQRAAIAAWSLSAISQLAPHQAGTPLEDAIDENCGPACSSLHQPYGRKSDHR